MRRSSSHDEADTEVSRLAFTLKDIQREGEQPLHVVFAKALKVLNRIGLAPGQAPDTGPLAGKPLCSASWLAKWALRAVCEAVAAEGMMPVPLAVNLRWKEGGRDFPSVLIPPLFLEYARKQGVNPRFLAEVALNDFVAKPPKKLRFRTRYPLDPGEVLDGGDDQLPPSGPS